MTFAGLPGAAEVVLGLDEDSGESSGELGPSASGVLVGVGGRGKIVEPGVSGA